MPKYGTVSQVLFQLVVAKSRNRCKLYEKRFFRAITRLETLATQASVGLVKSRGPFLPPDSAKNITLVLEMFSTFPDLSTRLTVPITFTACMKRKIIN